MEKLENGIWLEDSPYLYHGIYHKYGNVNELDSILDKYLNDYDANKITYREYLLLVLKFIIKDKYLISRISNIEHVEMFKGSEEYSKRKAIEVLNSDKEHYHSRNTISLSCANVDKYFDYLSSTSYDYEPPSYFARGILLAFNDNFLLKESVVRREEMYEFRGSMRNEIIVRDKLSIEYLEAIFIDSQHPDLLNDVLKVLNDENFNITIGYYTNKSYYDTQMELLGYSKKVKFR